MGEFNGRADDSKIREAVSRIEEFAARGENQTVVEPFETASGGKIILNTGVITNVKRKNYRKARRNKAN